MYDSTSKTLCSIFRSNANKTPRILFYYLQSLVPSLHFHIQASRLKDGSVKLGTLVLLQKTNLGLVTNGHRTDNSQLTLTLVPGNLIFSSGLHGCAHGVHSRSQSHAGKHTHAYKIKLYTFFYLSRQGFFFVCV